MAYYATYQQDETGELQKVVINAGVGFVLPYYGETAPPGTLSCDGSEISRAAYDELFAVLGTKAGAGNGSTTFNLPDLRGQFVRGTGGENNAPLGVRQEDAIRNITSGDFGLRVAETLGTGWLGYTMATTGVVAVSTANGRVLEPSAYVGDENIPVAWNIDVSRQVPTAPENRPVNVALLWCIIYE